MRAPHHRRAASLLAAALLLPGGCASNPFRTAAPAGPPSLEPPPAVAAPAHTLTPATPPAAVPSFADGDVRQAQTALARSRAETAVMQDEIAALREQLASTSSQLAQARSTALPVAPPASPAGPAGPPAAAAPGAGPLSPAAMQAAMQGLALPGLEPRCDGSVVRIDIPADRLFEEGTANLLPGGATLLSQIAAELNRAFAGHFVGIEGHLDTEPLQNATWASPHQLTAARSAAVFDFLTTRAALREGQLFLVAHGVNHPLVSNATAAGRSRNRRVELVIYPERAPGG